MIPSLGEIARALYGAWRLLLGDARGLTFFDDSQDGFWASFFAAVLVAPGYLLMTWLGLGHLPQKVWAFEYFVIQAIAYVIIWTAFPLAMVYVSQALDRSDRYRLHIVAYNWSQVIQHLLGLIIGVAFVRIGLLPEGVGYLLLAAMALYEWFIARRALNIPGFAAFGVVLLSFMAFFLLQSVSLGLLGLTPEDLERPEAAVVEEQR